MDATVTLMGEREPTANELAAIEDEWPLISAELALLDVEITCLQTGEQSSELSRRRLRRAQAALSRQIAAQARIGNELDGVA